MPSFVRPKHTERAINTAETPNSTHRCDTIHRWCDTVGIVHSTTARLLIESHSAWLSVAAACRCCCCQCCCWWFITVLVVAAMTTQRNHGIRLCRRSRIGLATDGFWYFILKLDFCSVALSRNVTKTHQWNSLCGAVSSSNRISIKFFRYFCRLTRRIRSTIP